MAIIEYNLPIYTYDIDFNGHVSNIVYIQWMEIGRLKLLDVVEMPIASIVEQGFGPVLVETEISYKKPLHLSDTVRAELWLSELGKASAWMEFRFYNGGGDVVASGRQRALFVNLSNGKPYKMNALDRIRFAPYVIQSEMELLSET